MIFTYHRTIRLADTDAAGVVYFPQVLSICHEAYEESLSTSGIKLRDFLQNSLIAIPVVHAEVDFFQPMFCGDQLLINLNTEQINENSFFIVYAVLPISLQSKELAKAKTKHVCINPLSRERISLPETIKKWLDS